MMKKIFLVGMLIMITFLVSCAPVENEQDYPGLGEANFAGQATYVVSNNCVDSDNGKNYEVLGRVNYTTTWSNGRKANTIYTDACVSGKTNRLKEYYCSGFVETTCKKGCSNGACIVVTPICTPKAATACVVGVSCPGKITIPATGMCPAGQSCSNGACVQIKSNCTDSDGLNFSTKGTVFGINGIGNAYTFNDSCYNTTSVYEYLCVQGVGLDLIYGICPNGCQDGVCVGVATCSKIAFTSTRINDSYPEIFVMNADGSNLIRLTNNNAFDGYPVWSPDGTKIVFDSDRDGNREIYLINTDGSNPTRLTNNGAFDGYSAWSPDGTQIAFTSSRDGNTEIYMMNTDGSNIRKLTNSSNSDSPSWSPDGTQIVFTSSRDGISKQIYVMNADGSNQIRLTNSSYWDMTPDWSPDRTQIVFMSNRDVKREIYLMNTDGSNLIRLTNNNASDGYPAWSPDGTKIVFDSDRDGGEPYGNRDHGVYNIYIMDANGSNQKRLTDNSSDHVIPDWVLQQCDN